MTEKVVTCNGEGCKVTKVYAGHFFELFFSLAALTTPLTAPPQSWLRHAYAIDIFTPLHLSTKAHHHHHHYYYYYYYYRSVHKARPVS